MPTAEFIYRLIFCLISLLTLFFALKSIFIKGWRNSQHKRIRKELRIARKNDPEASNRSFARKIREVNLVAQFIFYLTFSVGTLVIIYISNFAMNMPSTSPEQWGQMGDFFGGMLNPVFAFASFIALIYTIRLQSSELQLSRQELSETRQELKRSANAQENSGKALADQLAAIEHQKFENRFFKLIEMLNTEYQRVQGRHFHVICQHYETKKTENLKLDFEDFSLLLSQGATMFWLNNNGQNNGPFNRDKSFSSSWASLRHLVIVSSSRFTQLMDLLNLILGEVEKRSKPERYNSVVKALFEQNILMIIAIWCSLEDVDEYRPTHVQMYRNHKERYQGLKMRIELSGLLESLVTNANGDLSVHTSKLKINDLPYSLNAYGYSNYMDIYRSTH
jgi:uncharacterized membrane protein